MSELKEITSVPQATTPNKPPTSRTLDFGGSPAKALLSNARDMSLNDIKSRLKAGGSKVDKLKASLARFSELGEKLKEVEAQDEALKLKHFEKVVVEVPLR
jgi:hypothetical protein